MPVTIKQMVLVLSLSSKRTLYNKSYVKTHKDREKKNDNSTGECESIIVAVRGSIIMPYICSSVP